MPQINFVHANGFPSASYRKLFEHLDSDIDVIALDKYGHNPNYPVSNNWPFLVNELTTHVGNHASEPVIAVGHSFGAVLSYIAVCKRPELFSGLIMLDPPIVYGASRYLAKVAKLLPIIDKITPARTAVRRRRHWPAETKIYESFARRSFFKKFDPDCLKDYVDAIAVERNNRVELDFCADIEAEVFRSVPDNLNQFKGKLKVPSVLIKGALTDVSVDRFIKPFTADNDMRLEEFPKGGHMFPLEKPIETASKLNQLIRLMRA